MTPLRYTPLPEHPFDLGIQLSLPVYLTLITLHMVLHHQLIQRLTATNYRVLQRWSWLLIVSLMLLPLARGVHINWKITNMGLTFQCVYSGLRMSIVVARIVRGYTKNTTSEHAPRITVLDPKSVTFHQYMVALFLDGTPEHAPIRITDPMQQRLAAIPAYYDSVLVRLGWMKLPVWIRYLLRPLTYLYLMQLPLAIMMRNIGFLTHYVADPEEAARIAQISRIQAFGRWTVLMCTATLVLYFVMQILFSVLFGLLQATTDGMGQRGVFRQPWLSASPREFWSRRWNLPTQVTFGEAIYTPTHQLLDSLVMQIGKKHAALSEDVRRFNRLAAALVVFLASGLMHEYILIAAVGSKDFYHLRFFCCQGLMMVAYSVYEQVVRQAVSSRRLAHLLTSFPVGWTFTILSMALSAHWFYKPFLFKDYVNYMAAHAIA